MGGKKKGGGGHNFGRALIKDRFGRGNRTLNSDSFVSNHYSFNVCYLNGHLLLNSDLYWDNLSVLYIASYIRIGRWIRLGKTQFAICY